MLDRKQFFAIITTSILKIKCLEHSTIDEFKIEITQIGVFFVILAFGPLVQKAAAVAQLVEHVLGKDGVIGSIPISSSTKYLIRSDPR
jgi:hypothetical protein